MNSSDKAMLILSGMLLLAVLLFPAAGELAFWIARQ